MLINRRNAMMAGKRLPYDAELEYVYFDGAAVDTGLDYFPDFRVLAGTNGNVRNVTMYCNSSYLLERRSSTTPYWSVVVGDNQRITTDVTVSGVHLVELYGGVVKAEGNTYGTFANRTWGTGVRCHIPIGDSNTYQFYLYSAKLYDESHNLVRDYIPVRVSVNGVSVGALYDRANPSGGPNRNGLYFSSRNPLVPGPDVVPVEYIESHGMEYIDTGRPIPSDFWFDSTIDITGTSSAYKTFLGARIGSGTQDYQFSFESNYNRLLARYGTSNSQYFSEIPTGMTRIRVDSGGKLYINESTPHQLGVSTPSNNNLYVFALNNNGTVSQYANYIRLHSLKYGGLNEDHDLVPVRVGTEGAMMDVLTRRIYRNAGTGAFTYGNDLKYPIPAE